MRMTAARNHPAGDRHEVVVPGVEHAPDRLVAEPAHFAHAAVGAGQVDTGCPHDSPVTAQLDLGTHLQRTAGGVAGGVGQVSEQV